MKSRFYRWVRDLHLYLGLFISPFVLLFAVTVPLLVHSWLPRFAPVRASTRALTGLPLPPNLLSLSGRPLIDAVKPVLENAGIRGEVGFIRPVVKEGKLVIPVTIPGRETTVSIALARGDATS